MSSLSLLCLISFSLGAILWPSVLLRRLLDLNTYGGVYHFSVFPLFLKKVAYIISRKLSLIFRNSSVWDRFRSVGGLQL